jgi:hypothetical protein
MTTLAGWLGADSRGPASLYLVADSRITWFGNDHVGRVVVTGIWDYGRKTFAAQSSAEIFGYSGDVLFPTQTLGQITELIDRGVASSQDDSPEKKLQWIVDCLERSCKRYPTTADHGFSLLYCGRLGEGMACSFYAYSLEFKKGMLAASSPIEIPTASGPLRYFDGEEQVAFGSGRSGFREFWRTWKFGEAGGTSRAVFSAFADHLKSCKDPYSGGPPQLVGLYRKGAAKTFGIIWEQCRFFAGMEILEVGTEQHVNWHNDLFEICDPKTIERCKGAQRQPRPRSLQTRHKP